ncbi:MULTISPECIES: arylesterase [Pseudoalteromonas]|uniref:arylesterase n=1 Tax=Pseudoalteromonas TaxID=53246 RepID=UPI00029AEE41|nr:MULTISPECIES: arylesterase [Pseudoalteromonas]MCF2826050.1 arylesterase [Pseudoalteromonas sp. OF5H-5]MCF2833352.1 arylesterase [Pseudoalteromonas sp. DL2-H6]MCF2925001.1 arylesterase [Pseudoalteromonas sp. DL2-H1]MCF7513320.1 arylesterase [Pseudoalteromonas sp. L7]MCF7525703.1 arylesterase [Pseudoalteromonas sp. L23]
MKYYFLKLLFILVIVMTPLSANAKQKLMIVGDSLSAAYGLKQDDGWVKLLQNKYETEQNPIEIINVSVSGQTTGNAVAKINQQLKTISPTHVLIELGGNDGLRGFPVKRLKANLTLLVQSSQQAGANVAVMEIQIPPNLGPRYTSMFTESYQQVTEQTGSYLMPYFMLEVAAKPELMQSDNLHPNKEAQPLIRDFMYQEINQWLEK